MLFTIGLSPAKTTPPEPHDPLLNRWSDPPEPPPRLAADVWHRIALAESGVGSAPAARAAIEGWFARPPFALLFVTCCALLGLFLAEVRVNHLENERSAQLAHSYLRLIDPLLAAQNREPRP